MTKPDFDITSVLIIGDNRHGYAFGIGSIGGRWVGFATGVISKANRMIFLFPAISEDYELGITDRERCIKMTGAIAQSPENMYGGIERWFIEPELRGRPEDFRCANCQYVGCEGYCDV